MRRAAFLVGILTVLQSACAGGMHATRLKPEAVRVRIVDGEGRGGYIDGTGRLAIPARFDAVMPFQEDLARVQESDRWSFIDRAGKVVASGFEDAQDFSVGLALVRTSDNTWGFIDRTGKMTIVLEKNAVARRNPCGGGRHFSVPARPFHDGLAPARKDSLWGLMDTHGKWVVEPRYARLQPLGGGHTIVEDDQGLALLGPKGQLVRPALAIETNDGYEAAEGLLPGSNDEGKYGYVDLAGKVAIAPRFESAGVFHAGTAVVVLEDRTIVIDRTGKELFQVPAVPQDPPSEGLYTFAEEGSCGAIETTGKPIFKLACGSLGPFHDGLATFSPPDAPEFGLLDRTGKVVVTPRFMGPAPLVDGVACETVADSFQCVDRTGKILYRSK